MVASLDPSHLEEMADVDQNPDEVQSPQNEEVVRLQEENLRKSFQVVKEAGGSHLHHGGAFVAFEETLEV